jgi:hypothetical protein
LATIRPEHQSTGPLRQKRSIALGWGYDFQHGLVANSDVHLGSWVGSLSLLHAKCEGKGAHGKVSGVVEIAKNLIGSDLLCIPGL